MEVKLYVEDPKLAFTRRYRQLCPKLVKMASEVCACEENYNFINTGMDDLMEQVRERDRKAKHVSNDNDHEIQKESMSQPTRIKKKLGLKGKKRLKSWTEHPRKRKKGS